MTVGVGKVGKLLANEPHFVKTTFGQLGHELLVLFMTAVAQFAHLAKNDHLGFNVHQTEVVQGRAHRRGVGVVGINDKMVLFCHCQL